MSNSKVVGRLKGAKGPINIEWEIADFLSLPADVDKYVYSPTFFFCDASWYLQVYPNGEQECSSEGYIGVYLVRRDWGAPVTVSYSFFLKKTDGKEQVADKDMDTFDMIGSGWGTPKAKKKSELIEQKSKFLPSGVLTVMCSLKCDVGGTEKLSNDLIDLLDRGDVSDVTVKVENEEFHLHRAILAARTPVFNSMFKHNMQESTTGVVSIDDCEAVPFRAFVHYLYSGNTDKLSIENMFSLYKMADKYQANEFKESCLDFMKRSLSVDTFCNILRFALQHEEQNLIEQATDFLSENASDIMDSEDWHNIMKSYTKEISGLLKQGFVRNNKKRKL